MQALDNRLSAIMASTVPRSFGMSSEGEPRRRRSSFQILADALGATDTLVAPDDADARRREAPDPRRSRTTSARP